VQRREIMSDTKLLKAKLQKNQRIQDVMIEISQYFVDLSMDEYDDVINLSLEKLGKVLEADRAYMFKYHFEKNTMDNIYEWCAPSVSAEIDNLQNIPIIDFLDGWVNVHRERKNVIINDVEALDQSSNLYQILHPQGIQSILTMPIYVNDDCYGFIGFDFVKQRKPIQEYVEWLKLLPEMYTIIIKYYNILVALSDAKNEANKANTLQKEFFAKMTHEIRTPINGIVNAMYLLEQTGLSSEQKQHLDVLSYSLSSLQGLIENILSYTTIDKNDMSFDIKDVDLESEIVNLINSHKYMANKKEIGLFLNFDYAIPNIVSLDIEKLRQILTNLIQNGIKYTDFGHVDITVSLEKVKDPYVDILFKVKDTGKGISEEEISRLLNDSLEGKQTSSKTADGSGLGLSIANKLINLMDAELTIESLEEEGSSFEFTLTCYAKSDEASTKLNQSVLLVDIGTEQQSNIDALLNHQFETVQKCNEKTVINHLRSGYDMIFIYMNNMKMYQSKLLRIKPVLKKLKGTVPLLLMYDFIKSEKLHSTFNLYDATIELPSTSKAFNHFILNQQPDLDVFEDNLIEGNNTLSKKLLLVDDNMINRQVMSQLIRYFGFSVVEATNGYEAIDYVKKEQFDMIFMDILMPGINGYETTQQIRALPGVSGSLPIIAVTANESSMTKEQSLANGMNGVLFKPLNKAKLEKLLAEYFPDRDNLPSFDKRDVFNIKEFESFYDESSLRQEIVKTFVNEFNKDLEKLKEAFNKKDNEMIYAQVHYLKGSFTYLRANELLDLSQTILDLCRQQKMDEVLSYESEIIERMIALNDILTDYLNS
jgi:signal transduction histidine kinase/CheY-like chemotaxis protein